MPYTDCPKCFARVRVPDAHADSPVRCPKCGETFPAPAPAATYATPGAPSTAGGGVGTASMRDVPHDDPYAQLERTGRILSAADEAMLRELGSGSGLLEMTGEALQSGAVDFPRRAGTGGAGNAGGAGGGVADDLGGGGAAVGQLSDRQFQIVGTALTMANKLTEVYKAELARTRRLSLMTWSAAAVILVAAVIAFGWGMSQHSSATLEQSKSATSAQTADLLKTQVNDLRSQVADLKNQTTDLKAQTADVRAQAADLKTRYDDEKSRAAALTSGLDAAKARISQLQTDLDTARAASTTQSAPPSLVRP